MLHGAPPELWHEEPGEIVWRVEPRAGGARLQDGAAPQLDGGEHARGMCSPHARNSNHLREAGARESSHAARTGEQRVRQRQCVRSRRPVPDHQGDELVVTKGGGANPRELLARSVIRRQVLHVPSVLQRSGSERAPLRRRCCPALRSSPMPGFGTVRDRSGPVPARPVRADHGNRSRGQP